MDKAFDAKDLAARLKARGLDIAEELVKVAVEETLTWIEESVALTETKVDDIAAPVIEGMKPWVMKQIDQIDGKEG